MSVYHLLVVVFPIALWDTAFLFTLIRVVSNGRVATMLGNAVAPLVLVGLLGGVAAYVLGFFVWPYSALTASPLGRNHLLMATWTLAYWTVLWVLAWRLGERLWIGVGRWVALALGALGVALLTITGTLGGSLAGNPSGVSDLVRALGWEVYTTFYVPNATLWVMFAAAAVLLVLGVWARKQPA
jgi:Predicted membrane protein (DUF2231)